MVSQKHSSRCRHSILAGLIAAIVEQKKLFDQKQEEEAKDAEDTAECAAEETAEAAEKAEADESIELTPDHPDGESEE